MSLSAIKKIHNTFAVTGMGQNELDTCLQSQDNYKPF
jgi:hypothetical protein